MGRPLRGLVISAVLVVAAAACGGGDDEPSANRDYIESTRREFLGECRVDGGTDAACMETLECVEQELTADEWAQLTLDKGAGYDTPELDEVYRRCGYP